MATVTPSPMSLALTRVAAVVVSRGAWSRFVCRGTDRWESHESGIMNTLVLRIDSALI
jgi:hypothetical protein